MRTLLRALGGHRLRPAPLAERPATTKVDLRHARVTVVEVEIHRGDRAERGVRLIFDQGDVQVEIALQEPAALLADLREAEAWRADS